MTIKVIGLGPGHLEEVSLKIWRLIEAAPRLYCRTADHPAVQELIDSGKEIYSFDGIYEEEDEVFQSVYPKIVAELVRLAQEEGDILYAVPGHPRVAEDTVTLLLQQEEVDVEVVGGASFIDAFFAAVSVDPIQGFQLLDALDFSLDDINPRQALVFMQVYHSFVASDLKLDLMEIYPDDHLVALVDAAGSPEERVRWCPLYEMDHFDGVHNLLSVYVSPLRKEEADAPR